MPYQPGYVPPLSYAQYGAYGGQQQQQQQPQAHPQTHSQAQQMYASSGGMNAGQYPSQHMAATFAQQQARPTVVPQAAAQFDPTSPHLYSPKTGCQGYLQPQVQLSQGQFYQYQPGRPQMPSPQGQYQGQQYYQPQVAQPIPSHGYHQAQERQQQQRPSQSAVGRPLQPPPIRQPSQVGLQQRSTLQQPAQPRPVPSAYPEAERVRSAPQQSHQTTATPTSSREIQPTQSTPTSSHQTTATPAGQAQAPSRLVENLPSSQQCTATHVQIPVHHGALPQTGSEMPREAKRRRSNEGKPIAVCDASAPPQKSTSSQRVKQAPPVSSPLTELASSQLPPTPPNYDYQSTLLALSDEYVGAAYAMGGSLASAVDGSEDLEHYHGLMSMGMACLESVLKNYRQPDARREARIRLRLATLMHDETENTMECEEVLSKGIQVCERSKLVDLKHAMHHLSARVTAKTNPKAAIKAVEKLGTEVHSLKLIHWVYAFHFLRISISLHSGLSETPSVLKTLHTLGEIADRQRHTAIQIVAAAIEAMVHLRSGSGDSLDLAQRALAAARTHQLSEQMQALPQILVLLDCLDLASAMMQFTPEQVGQKLRQMHATMDVAAKAPNWNKDGSFTVPMGIKVSEHLVGDAAGIITGRQHGEASMSLKWLTSSQLYALGYFLSGTATMHKDALDQRAGSYLAEGLKLCNALPDSAPRSVVASRKRLDWQASLRTTLRLQQALACCAWSDWSEASRTLRNVQKELQEHDQIESITKAMLIYLEAVCKHGQGSVEEALLCYSDHQLIFQNASKEVSALRDLQTLATLDRILILRSLSGAQEADALLAGVENYCLTHSNRALSSAYYIVKATADNDNAVIIKRKQYLQSAVQAAQAIKNQQMLCVILSCMTDMFFRGIVGEQATKSAQAARSLAHKTQNKLWLAVTNKMYADTAELCGEHDNAAIARQKANQSMDASPQELKRRLGKSND